MSNWKCLFITSIFFLALFPLSVQGTSENDTSLEAREIQAVYNENETTTITWRNIDTDMYSLIDELKSSNYSVLRFDEPITISNYQSSRTEVPGCQKNDSWLARSICVVELPTMSLVTHWELFLTFGPGV